MQDLLIENIHNVSAAEYDREYLRLDDPAKSRIDRMKHTESKYRTLLGRMLARKSAGQICGVDPDDISIAVDVRGKPYAVGRACCFSISHSGEWVVCAFDTSEIGVDIERIRPIKTDLLKRVCTDEECEYVLGEHIVECDVISDADVIRRFFEIWTLKEAYFKAIGSGITDFKSINVIDDAVKRRTYYMDGFVIGVIYI